MKFSVFAQHSQTLQKFEFSAILMYFLPFLEAVAFDRIRNFQKKERVIV